VAFPKNLPLHGHPQCKEIRNSTDVSFAPGIKTGESSFEPKPDWEWAILITLKHPVDSSLGTSEPVTNLSFANEEVYIKSQRHSVVGGGLIGLCRPDEEVVYEGFETPIRYGDITTQLRALIAKLGTPEQPEAKFITTTTKNEEAAS
jgi:hypothetical protein